MFYFVPYYGMAIYGLLNPGQHWMVDWSLLHAGAAAQVKNISYSVFSRTVSQERSDFSSRYCCIRPSGQMIDRVQTSEDAPPPRFGFLTSPPTKNFAPNNFCPTIFFYPVCVSRDSKQLIFGGGGGQKSHFSFVFLFKEITHYSLRSFIIILAKAKLWLN